MKCHKKLYGTAVIDGSDTEEIEENRKIELEYYQLKNNISNKPYGIEIVKRCIKNMQTNIEDKMIYNIYEKEQEVANLLKILLSNKVTPITLEDIIEDLKAI